jgi:hypothetical protein
MTQAMPGFLDYIRKNSAGVWFTPAGQVAEWWRQRDRVSLSVKNSGAGMDLGVSVTQGNSVAQAAAIVMLPYKNAKTVVAGSGGRDAALAVARMDDYRALVRFPPMMPGNYNYHVTFAIN